MKGHWSTVRTTVVTMSRWPSGLAVSATAVCSDCNRLVQIWQFDELTNAELADVLAEAELPVPGIAIWHDGGHDALLQGQLPGI